MRAASHTRSFRIAVLDDSRTTRLLVQRLLTRQLGCEVAVYETSAELTAACAQAVPDLFLLDVVLVSESGIEVCRQLKAAEATRDVPVIFFSEHNQPQTRVEALRAGGEDYVDKPFYPEEFLARVEGTLERFRRRQLMAEQAREQQALLRVLCHDLRNSVGAGWTMLKQLKGAEGEEERDVYLDVCGRAIGSALELIAHVGEYRSLLDGSCPFKVEVVDAAAACGESCNLLLPAAAAKNIDLQIRVGEGLTLVANRVVLVHNIINNLLSNAVKFSRPGSTVWLEAHAETRDERECCCVSVRDEGVGIPPAILAHLLKKQLVVSRLGTEQEAGSGIGMTLVQLYVERSEGSICLESQSAEGLASGQKTGTIVRVWFPRVLRQPASESDLSPVAGPTSLPG